MILEQSPKLYALQSNPFTRSACIDFMNVWDLCLSQSHPDREPSIWTTSHLKDTFVNHSEDQRTLGDSLLQRSLKLQAVARYTISNSSDSFTSSTESGQLEALTWLEDLAETDPDTCCEILDSLETIKHMIGSRLKSPVAASILHRMLRLIILAKDDEVRSRSQSVLANALVIEDLRVLFFSVVQEADLLRALEVLERECLEGSPSNVQSAVRLQGYFLDHAFNKYPLLAPDLYRRIGQYVRLLRMAIIDTNVSCP
jgi:hypothetical protein